MDDPTEALPCAGYFTNKMKQWVNFMRKSQPKWIVYVFLALELLLFITILTSGGKLLIWSEFISIVLCFLFAVLHIRKESALLCIGLGFSVMADLCLVVCDPIQQLWGMVFFLGAQTCYAIFLHRQGLCKAWLVVRIVLTVLIEGVTLFVLRENTDPLAMVSMAYYVNLILNLICAFARFKRNRLLAIGFIFFLLCDTVIGLQTAAGAYLPIGADSFIYRIIFMPFHLSWFFYLPSQVLIALYNRMYKEK